MGSGAPLEVIGFGMDETAQLAGKAQCLRHTQGLHSSNYREWIDGLSLRPAPDFGPSFERIAKPDNGGADLLLANVRLFGKLISPTGQITVLDDWGTLVIHALSGDWHLFQVEATHAFNSHDGLGAHATMSNVTGVVHLPRGKGTWASDPGAQAGCVIHFDRLAKNVWRLEERGMGCSGLGSTLTGLYRK